MSCVMTAAMEARSHALAAAILVPTMNLGPTAVRTHRTAQDWVIVKACARAAQDTMARTGASMS